MAKEETEWISGIFPKSVADKIKASKDVAIQESVIDDYIKASKDLFQESLEELDVNLKEYRIMAQKTSIEIRKAREEIQQYESELWEKFDQEKKNLNSKVSSI